VVVVVGVGGGVCRGLLIVIIKCFCFCCVLLICYYNIIK